MPTTTQPTILAELVLVDRAGTAATLRVSYNAQRPFPPGDPDRPNVRWMPRLVEAPNVEVGVSLPAAGGVGEAQGGSLRIANADGALDWARGHTCRSVRVWYAPEPVTAFADLTPVFSGVGGMVDVDVRSDQPSRLTIRVADPRRLLERTCNAETYAGTSTGTGAGYEGAADMAGVAVPRALGYCRNVPPVRVNVADAAWQPGAGPLDGLAALYAAGVNAGLTSDGDKSGSTFDSYSATSGRYATDLARGLIKAPPADMALTVDLRGEVSGTYAEDAPTLVSRLLDELGQTVDAAPTDIARVGLWTGAQATPYRPVLEDLARSAGAFLVPTAEDGVWRLTPLSAPADPVATVRYTDVVRLEPGRPTPPAWRIAVLYARNHQVMRRSEVAGIGSGDAERLAFLEAEWRRATWEDTAVRDSWPDAVALEVQTALQDQSDAEALRDRVRTWFGEPRESYRVTVPMALASGLRLLDAVRLVYPPRGIDALFRVTRQIPFRPRATLATVEVWG